MRLAIVLAEAKTSTVTGSDGVQELVLPAARLSTALALGGHDVTVYLPDDGLRDPDPDGLRVAPGYRVVRLPAGRMTRLRAHDGTDCLGDFTQHLQRAWQHDRPDVVHAQSWLSGMVGQLAARALDIPVVQSFDALACEELRNTATARAELGDRLKLEPILARRASWVIANNTAEMFELLRMGSTRSRISVVPCGVDGEVFTPPGPAAERSPLPHRIVSVATSTGFYDFETVIRALGGLPDTELAVAIDASSPSAVADAATARKLAEAVGVADRTVVADVRDAGELAQVLRSADVCACTALTEPSGAAALMAMSCGVPVIATEVGALADIVVDDVTGRLVAPGDIAGFTEAARRLLHEPFAGRGMGAAGRDRSRSRYTWDRVAADAVRAYSGALGTLGVVSA